MAATLHPDDRVPVGPGTKHRDYILTDYTPVVDPAGLLQPVSLLRGALRDAGLLEPFAIIEAALRAELGPDETVWGLKYDSDGLQSVELYFYAAPKIPGRGDRSVSRITAVLTSLGLDVPGGVDEALPYFLCSVDLDRRALLDGECRGFRVYVQSGETDRVPCGISYRVNLDGYHLENHYWFYRAGETHDAHARLTASPHAGGGAAHAALICPSLLPCHTICFATKPRADGLYFSRLTTSQTLGFLAESSPQTAEATETLRSLLTSHRAEFAHARWDLGFDFHAPSPTADHAPIHKVGLHGIF
jgi:hypothetical protein